MKQNRRTFCVSSAAALSAVLMGGKLAFADEAEFDAALKQLTGDAEPGAGGLTLKTPEIAENGNTVPVSVSVDSPMTEDSYVSEVTILASGNPRPGVATFRFTPMSGEAKASTRIRLAKSQDLVAVAKMSDGSILMDRRAVKVTIGGCGG